MMAETYHHEIPGMSRFEDMIIGDAFPEEKILKLRDSTEFRPSDVLVSSYPKTGTTLLQEIVYLIRNGGDVNAANQIRNVVRVPFMELGYKDNFEVFAKLPHPRTVKTHVPYRFLPAAFRENKAKVVYIIRNPKDTLVSYYHFYRMNKMYNNFKGTWTDYFNYFMSNDAMVGYGNPMDHYRGYWEHRNDENMHIVFYEHLIRNPVPEIKSMSKFLDSELEDDAISRIADATNFGVMRKNPMTNMDSGPKAGGMLDHSISPFMRKGKVGDWKNHFTDEQNQIIDVMVKKRLSGLDLEFIYE